MFQYYFVLEVFAFDSCHNIFIRLIKKHFIVIIGEPYFPFAFMMSGIMYMYFFRSLTITESFFIFAVVASIVGYCLTILFEKCFECMLLLLMTIIIPDVITNKVLTLRVYQG